nr:HAUS augmin-like complex subunit 2 [Lytechinus pictus]
MDEFSFNKSNRSINPWCSDVHSISATSSIIRFAEKTGHLRVKREEDMKEIEGNLHRQSPSLRLIEQLREVAEKRKRLDQVNVEIQCRLMDKDTRDLTHLDLLESKISNLNALSSHLQRILQGKKELINRLQQPLVGDFLRVEATFHPQVKELFPLVVSCLAELSANLDNIQWGSEFDLRDGRVAAILDDIATSLAQLQTRLHTVMQVRSLVTEL